MPSIPLELWLPQRTATIAECLGRLCHGGPVKLSIAEPASERDVDNVELEIGRLFPNQLREFYLRCSASFRFDWYFDWEFCQTLPASLADVNGGLVDFCLASQKLYWINWRDDWSERFTVDQFSPNGTVKYEFENLFPVLVDSGGNSLVLVTGGPNVGSVLMQGFEDLGMKNARLANSFEGFLEIWSKLGFVGPDPLPLRPFYDKDADLLSLDLSTSKEWRRICGLDKI